MKEGIFALALVLMSGSVHAVSTGAVAKAVSIDQANLAVAQAMSAYRQTPNAANAAALKEAFATAAAQEKASPGMKTAAQQMATKSGPDLDAFAKNIHLASAGCGNGLSVTFPIDPSRTGTRTQTEQLSIGDPKDRDRLIYLLRTCGNHLKIEGSSGGGQ